MGQYQLNLAPSILGWEIYLFCSDEGLCPFLKGDDNEIVKIHPFGEI